MKKFWIIGSGRWFWLLIMVACTPFSPATPTATPNLSVTLPPTETIAAASLTSDPSPTPENCITGWMWAYGTAPDEFVQVVQTMMATAQISGTVRVSTYGENDGCGRYHAMSTDFTFTIPTPDPTDEVALAPLADTLTQLAQTANQGENRPAPNLGNLEITFENDVQRCYWRRSGGAGEWNKRCEVVGNS